MLEVLQMTDSFTTYIVQNIFHWARPPNNEKYFALRGKAVRHLEDLKHKRSNNQGNTNLALSEPSVISRLDSNIEKQDLASSLTTS